jgi:hypothetical protein
VSYFSVMVKSPTGAPGAGPVAHITSTGVVYPAKEAMVFTWPEGAFYGDIFHAPSPLTSSAQPSTVPLGPCGLVTPDVLSGRQYACAGPTWTVSGALDADRLCAVAGSPCFSATNAPQACAAACATSTELLFNGCRGADPAAPPWKHTMTVHVNHPCDLSPDPRACGAIYPLAQSLVYRRGKTPIVVNASDKRPL